MNEAEFRKKVNHYLNEVLRVYNIPYVAGEFGISGVPDKLICYEGKFIGIELKREDGKLTKLQRRQIKKINYHQGVSFVLRPQTFEYGCRLLELHNFDELRKLE